jgi:hypothetical protein
MNQVDDIMLQRREWHEAMLLGAFWLEWWLTRGVEYTTTSSDEQLKEYQTTGV